MAPALSVVIPSRNAEATIGVQLGALAAQRADVDWEVLVADNGSSDGTRTVVERYRDRLPGLRVVEASGRRGPGHARNVGAAAASGRWLAFVDADDEVGEGWLQAVVDGLGQHDVIAGRFEVHRLNAPSVTRSRRPDQDTGLQYSPFGLALPHAGAGNLAVTRAAFEAVGGFDVGLTCLEDTDFCWRVQLAGHPLVFWPDAVVHVRLRSSLRRMWAQGRVYGAAAAELDHRYRDVAADAVPARSRREPADPPPADVSPASSASTDPRVAPARSRLLPDPGHLVWVAGWHVGHRTWRPRSGPGPAPAAGIPAAGTRSARTSSL